MSPRVFLCAGHELGGGASANGLWENPYNFLVGRIATEALQRLGVDAELAPLSLAPYPDDIHAKTAWINDRARDHDLAIDIHLDINDPGCAAFALDEDDELRRAGVLSAAIARRTGLRSRGGRPEGETAPGKLGFLHGTDCRAVLVELCSMNTSDAEFAKRPGARRAFGEGLARGCLRALECGGA
jgi:N-acetylmuramoyl-L-alanine amidase